VALTVSRLKSAVNADLVGLRAERRQLERATSTFDYFARAQGPADFRSVSRTVRPSQPQQGRANE
jgi:hypothetical protein